MPKSSVYLDSCTWIAQYNPDEDLTADQRTGLKTLQEKAEKGEVLVVASSLLLVEVLSVSIEVIESAFDGKRGLMVAADDGICGQARRLQEKCSQLTGRRLSHYDAVHLTTASVMGCQQFVTLDRKRKNNQLSPIGNRSVLERLLGLKILDPAELDDQKRFDFRPGDKVPDGGTFTTKDGS